MEYQNKVQEPHSDINRGMSTNIVRTYLADHIANLMNFFKMNRNPKLMEGVLRDIRNVTLYLDDLLMDTETQKSTCKHLIKFCPAFTKII
jgi:hypothetical protein